MVNEIEKDMIDEGALPVESVISQVPVASEGEVTPLHLLSFAKLILLFVAIIYVIAGVSELIKEGNGFYEISKVTLPSIATLVIGYYFGSTK